MTSVDPWHGTHNGYNNHRCRCDECREAERAYRAERRDRLRGPDWTDPRFTGRTYGTRSTYRVCVVDNGTACAECRHAESSYRKRYRHAMSASVGA